MRISCLDKKQEGNLLVSRSSKCPDRAEEGGQPSGLSALGGRDGGGMWSLEAGAPLFDTKQGFPSN